MRACEECRMHPFGVPKKLIQIDGLEETTAEQLAPLTSLVAKAGDAIAPQTTLILCFRGTCSSSALVKAVNSHGLLLQIPPAKPWELPDQLMQWVMQTASKEGWNLSAPLARCFVERIGAQESLIRGEWTKLQTLTIDRKEISQADIDAITLSNLCEDGWKLGEALMRRDAAHALEILRSALERGESWIGLLYQLRFQFAEGYRIAEHLSLGGKESELGELFPKTTPGMLRRKVGMVRQYGLSSFGTALEQLFEAEKAAKGGSNHSDEQLSEWFLLQLIHC